MIAIVTAVRPPLPLLVAATLAGALAAGCSAPSDPVLQVVEDVRAAAEERDAQAVVDRLAEDFRGEDGIDRAEALATLRRYFAAYESVDVTVYDVAVARRTENEAEVGCRVEFTGAARRIGGLDGFLPPAAVMRFDVRLVRRGPDWKVAAAEWTPIEPVAPPATSPD
ncbi:MAG TPA: hypothetical protein VMR21_03680 [Vicinamibacteria bacterium]|nr:hypothetical protein [Vicinamibacteria bacterium]